MQSHLILKGVTMPKIFSDQDRKIIKNKLLNSGLQLLEAKPYKSISLDEVTKLTGIAKGTFYNFFSSKESFFYEIIQLIKERNREPLITLFSNTLPSKDEIETCLFHRYTQMKTVYDYFTIEEINLIMRKLPSEDYLNDSVDFAKSLLEAFNVHDMCRIEVIVNMLNVLALTQANRSILNATAYDQTIHLMVHTLTDYILKEENI